MILMERRRDIWINVLIIGSIIIGYVIATAYNTKLPLQTISFESASFQAPLKPLTGSVEAAPVTLKDFRGQNVLIHFWASWCEACRAEKEVFNKLADAYRGTPVKVIGIATSDGRDAVMASGMLEATSYPHYLDESGELAQALSIKFLPQTLLVNSQGQIVTQIQGPLDQAHVSQLEEKMSALVQAQGGYGMLPNFKLQSSLGNTVELASLKDKVWVADFIFTGCQDFCPVLTQKMRTLHDEFKDRDDLRFVSFTVDPENDSPAVLRQYQGKQRADSSRWYFLTGKMEDIKSLLINGFKLGTPDEPRFHTSRFVLLNGVGEIQGYYDSESEGDMQKLKADIRRLLK